MNQSWQEKFDKEFGLTPLQELEGVPGSYQVMHLTVDAKDVKAFISQTISSEVKKALEEVIEKIPDSLENVGNIVDENGKVIKAWAERMTGAQLKQLLEAIKQQILKRYLTNKP